MPISDLPSLRKATNLSNSRLFSDFHGYFISLTDGSIPSQIKHHFGILGYFCLLDIPFIPFRSLFLIGLCKMNSTICVSAYFRTVHISYEQCSFWTKKRIHIELFGFIVMFPCALTQRHFMQSLFFTYQVVDDGYFILGICMKNHVLISFILLPTISSFRYMILSLWWL